MRHLKNLGFLISVMAGLHYLITEMGDLATTGTLVTRAFDAIMKIIVIPPRWLPPTVMWITFGILWIRDYGRKKSGKTTWTSWSDDFFLYLLLLWGLVTIFLGARDRYRFSESTTDSETTIESRLDSTHEEIVLSSRWFATRSTESCGGCFPIGLLEPVRRSGPTRRQSAWTSGRYAGKASTNVPRGHRVRTPIRFEIGGRTS